MYLLISVTIGSCVSKSKFWLVHVSAYLTKGWPPTYPNIRLMIGLSIWWFHRPVTGPHDFPVNGSVSPVLSNDFPMHIYTNPTDGSMYLLTEQLIGPCFPYSNRQIFGQRIFPNILTDDWGGNCLNLPGTRTQLRVHGLCIVNHNCAMKILEAVNWNHWEGRCRTQPACVSSNFPFPAGTLWNRLG